MKKLSEKFDFWHWFGILSAFILCLWGSVIVFNILIADNDHELIASGEYYDFSIPPFENYVTDKFERNFEIDAIEEMIPEIIENPRELAGDLFFYCSNKYPKNHIEYLGNFNSFWRFKIRNSGTEIIENINLEIPLSGKFLLTTCDEESYFSDFNRKIVIEKIKPSENVNVLVWANKSIPSFETFVPSKARVVYPDGSTEITYPIKATGFVAWNARNDNYPLIFGFGGVLVLTFFLVLISFRLGMKNAKKEIAIAGD